MSKCVADFFLSHLSTCGYKWGLMDILLPNCRTCHVYSVNSLVSFKSFLCHKNEMTPSKQVSGLTRADWWISAEVALLECLHGDLRMTASSIIHSAWHHLLDLKILVQIINFHTFWNHLKAGENFSSRRFYWKHSLCLFTPCCPWRRCSGALDK